MAYTDIDKPSDYFNTKLYTGTGSELAITGVGFSPNWVWIKIRNESSSHEIFDSVRGATKTINSNSTNAEATQADTLKSFDSDGFTLGDNGDVNYDSSQNGVSWNWKAGTAFSNDASATGIGSIDSSGSVNTDAGFSIVSYTGTENLQTVKHGLSTVPSMIFFKNRSASASWKVYDKSLGATKGLKLDSSDAHFTSAGNFNNTEPTSSVFTVNTDVGLNGSGNSIIAYCFADVKGYSKFGSYVGNGNADGTFIYTGFKPAFVMVKRTDAAESWFMYDNKRNAYSGNERYYVLKANTTDAENTTYGDNWQLDFLSNGFKWRTTAGHLNGGDAIFMAFAENPFTTSTGIPATAR